MARSRRCSGETATAIIAFKALVGGAEQWHSAVMMSADVVEAMINRLEEILEELRSAAA
jgi:hypothetical protein